MYFSFLLLLLSCKNEPILSLEDSEINIKSIKADFEKKTGYQQTDSFFVNASFRSVINWNTFYESGKDTLYVKVRVLDRLEVLVADSTRILLNNNVWIRGTRNGEAWKYSVLTFIPSSKATNYSGAIISKSVQSGAQNISFYESNVKVSTEMVKKAGKAPAMPTNCVYGYINGYLNEISCSGGGSSGDENNPTYPGDPRDYQNFPPSGGGGGTGGDGTVPTYNEVPDNPEKEAENFNDAIDDANLPDCMKQVLAALKNLNGNTVADIIKKFAGEVPGYNLKFVTENFSDPMQVAGTNRNNYNGEMIIGFNINPTVIGNATDLALGTTMLHESIHAYLVAFYYNDPAAAKLSYPELFVKYSKQKAFSNGIQHVTFAKNFITDIAASIKNYGELKGYKLDKQVYDDIAWKGLVETEAFKSLSDAHKARIIDRIMAEQYDSRKEKNVTQKGTRLGC
ncbi:hypothetical protein KO02_11395 [Sphingobacterium sp. ML3W]|nr:hypothetical protein KO02_11395 [Sphingobacterium sp. ML3W]